MRMEVEKITYEGTKAVVTLVVRPFRSLVQESLFERTDGGKFRVSVEGRSTDDQGNSTWIAPEQLQLTACAKVAFDLQECRKAMDSLLGPEAKNLDPMIRGLEQEKAHRDYEAQQRRQL